MPMLEAQASNVAKAAIDAVGSLIVVMTDTTQPVRLVAKYKPGECRAFASGLVCAVGIWG